MKVDRKAKFCIFFTITVIALGLGNIAAVYTGDLLSSTLPGLNGTDKLIALDDDNFSPTSLNTVYEQKEVVQEVNNTTELNDTNVTSDNSGITNNSESNSGDINDNSDNGDDSASSNVKPSESTDE